MCLQIAHVKGARVIAVARGAEKAQALKGLGADAVIDTAAVSDKPLRASIKVHVPLAYNARADDVYPALAALISGAWLGE